MPVVITAGLLFAVSGIAGAGAKRADHGCPATVAAVRQSVPRDRPAALLLPFRVGTDASSVPGPDSLRLFIHAPDGHPRVLMENLRTGHREDLVGTWATRPAWSPNGRYFACVTYPSQEQSYQLTVIDRRTRQRTVIEARVAANEYRWSPDSRWIAVEGVERGTIHVVLSVYDLAKKRVRRIASAHALASFGLSWSPDSKLLAFTWPTDVDDAETVLAADVWIATTSDWIPCRTRQTPNEVEGKPEWLSDSSLLITVVPRAAPRSDGHKIVLELRR
jgi:Tol biopolymer transport system component